METRRQIPPSDWTDRTGKRLNVPYLCFDQSLIIWGEAADDERIHRSSIISVSLHTDSCTSCSTLSALWCLLEEEQQIKSCSSLWFLASFEVLLFFSLLQFSEDLLGILTSHSKNKNGFGRVVFVVSRVGVLWERRWGELGLDFDLRPPEAGAARIIKPIRARRVVAVCSCTPRADSASSELLMQRDWQLLVKCNAQSRRG